MFSTNLQKRLAMFLVFCVPIRLVWAELARRDPRWARVALVPAVGLLLLYITGVRRSGPETLGEPIHWNYARPYHAALLLMATGLSLVDSSYAGIALYMDAALAAVVVLTYHYGAHSCIS